MDKPKMNHNEVCGRCHSSTCEHSIQLLFENWRKFLKEDYPFNTKAKGSGRIGITGINAQDDIEKPGPLWGSEEEQEDSPMGEKKKKKYIEPALQDDYIDNPLEQRNLKTSAMHPSNHGDEEEIDEDYQKQIAKTHQKEKKRIITTGANKTKAAPFVKNPETKRSKSSPSVGFGGSP